MKNIKRFVCLILSLSLALIISLPVAASNNLENDHSYREEDYEKYTIDFNNTDAVMFSNQNRSSGLTNEDRIELAIEYVESLELESMGYEHIEEACLSELEEYRMNGVILDKYSVLVPLNTRSVLSYFGTYAGDDFYYSYTSEADFRVEKMGTKMSAKNESDWHYWINGAINLVLCFVNYKFTVPYTLITTVTGVPGTSQIHYESYNEYVTQYTNVVTRNVYRDERGTMKLGYVDQLGNARVKLYFCPVGTAFASDYIEIGEVFNGSVRVNTFSDEKIMQSCRTNAIHNAQYVLRLISIKITEQWGE